MDKTMKSQMHSGPVPSTKGVGGGEYDANHAPFGAKHDVGNGWIPMKFFDGMTGTPAEKIVPTQTGAPASAEPRPGSRQYPFGGR